jgi:putative transposase
MNENTVVRLAKPGSVNDGLSELLRNGAVRLIEQAVAAELDEFLEGYRERRDERGRRAVVRNGYQPERAVLTGIGPVRVKVPKVRSRSEESVVFRSQLVPPYVRRARSIEAALPWLYLHGVSTGDMAEALEVLVGANARGLSAPVVSRLKRVWSDEYDAWRKRRLDQDRWVYCGLTASIRGYGATTSAYALWW